MVTRRLARYIMAGPVYMDAADVFGHAAHEVAGAVGLVEVGVEGLVVGVYLVFLVVFDVAAHDDDGLAHEEEEEAGDKGEDEEGDAGDSDDAAEAGVVEVEGADVFADENIVVGGVAGGGFGCFGSFGCCGFCGFGGFGG